jgi:hypothetical protein
MPERSSVTQNRDTDGQTDGQTGDNKHFLYNFSIWVGLLFISLGLELHEPKKQFSGTHFGLPGRVSGGGVPLQSA